MAAVAFHPTTGLGVVVDRNPTFVPTHDAAAFVSAVDERCAPRWAWWDQRTPHALVGAGIAVQRCWDVVAVHRLLEGGWRWHIATVWASLHDLDPATIPRLGQLGLLDQPADDGGDPDQPIQIDGHLRPEWTAGAWSSSGTALTAWAATAATAAELQTERLQSRADPARAISTAHAESGASTLCAELERSGLPIDVEVAEHILETHVGPRTHTVRDEDDQREKRDALVLRHVEPPQPVNLRSSEDVRAMLRRLDVEVEDTRAWRLERVRDAHPVVGALLAWRKAERLATTYGYRWLDDHVDGGRLRGEWSSSDGSAGRMTASAGLHNLPADLRPAIRAEGGHAFVRADLGQVEPRVLASVSGDAAFIAATASPDLYDEVATQLGVYRGAAKLAVLGAMYGATTGESAHALRRLERAYPTAMAYLEDAARRGVHKVDAYTIGGRRIRLSGAGDESGDIDAARNAAASRGRYARNAVIQGAAAEFFKVWALVVRSELASRRAEIVLCLHDELLVHTPADIAEDVATLVREGVDRAARIWSPSPATRFVADVQVIERWSDAKP